MRVIKKRYIVAFALLLAGMVLFASRQPVVAAPGSQAEFHTVQSGDSWTSIAAYYVVPVESIWRANGVTNPARLAEGQRLFIPKTGNRTHTGVLLFEITTAASVWRAAVTSGNSMAGVLEINGLDSPVETFSQRIFLPNRQSIVASTTGVATLIAPPTAISAPPTQPSPQPAPTATPPPGDVLVRSRIGIQGHFLVEDSLRRNLLDMVAYDLGSGWVKQQIAWEDFEYAPGQYSDVMLTALDAFMHDAYSRGLRIMLSIAKAPDWARSTTEADGPPADYARFNEFIKFIVLRYKYRIAAIEIWNEPNLRREWTGATMSGAEYVRLLAGAYQTVKREYPEGAVVVVSAGLAPTGINDGITAIDDRTFLRQMYQAGVAQYADAIGFHPYSWGNPPWTRCCGNWGGAPSHNDHPSFFFLNTVEDYRAIQLEFGDGGRQLWATEFGWGTMDGTDRPIPPDAPFFQYVNQEQQGQYIVEAYRMGQQRDFMGPMFLWNLNVATLPNADNNQSGYSLLTGNLQQRRAYQILRDTPKADQ